jgi:XRE family transcriptional regulator of biofilm formation
MYSAKTLSDRLHLLRRDMKWDQSELAERSGVSRGYISEIERGVKQNVGVEVVFALAEALGVSVAYLLGEIDSPLGESDAKVMREMAGEYVTVDVDSDDERRLIRTLIAEFNALPRRAQVAAIEIIRTLRKVESEPDETHLVE